VHDELRHRWFLGKIAKLWKKVIAKFLKLQELLFHFRFPKRIFTYEEDYDYVRNKLIPKITDELENHPKNPPLRWIIKPREMTWILFKPSWEPVSRKLVMVLTVVNEYMNSEEKIVKDLNKLPPLDFIRWLLLWAKRQIKRIEQIQEVGNLDELFLSTRTHPNAQSLQVVFYLTQQVVQTGSSN
jgi:hypothetical protein